MQEKFKYLAVLIGIVGVAIVLTVSLTSKEPSLDSVINDLEGDLAQFQSDLEVWNEMLIAADSAADGILADVQDLSNEFDEFSAALQEYQAELQAIEQSQSLENF